VSEEAIFLTSGAIRLDARWSPQPGERGAVVCHPHPLYGGDMDNYVVVALTQALNSCGFSALRFNFRGVGESEGRHGEGIAEREDLKSACDFLAAQGKKDIVVAGYSFGAWVACNAAGNLSATSLALVSPPIAMMNFDFHALPIPFWVICGERDAFCPEKQLGKSLAGAPQFKELKWIAKADHFYAGQIKQISAAVTEWFCPHADNKRSKEKHL